MEIPVLDFVATIIAAVVLPFSEFFTPNNRMYWLYLLAPYALALLIYLKMQGSWSRSAVISCIKYFFPWQVYAHRSAIADYMMLFIRSLLYVSLLPFLLVNSAFVASLTHDLISSVTSIESLYLEPTWVSRLALTLLWVFAWDSGAFFTHYLHHKVPFLWEFHKIHHSAEVLTPVTVFRLHPVNEVINMFFFSVFPGVVNGVFLFLYADPVSYVMVNGLNIVWFLFLMFGYNLRHTHIWIMYPKWIRYIISSPALHMIHHSDHERHYDKNFSNIFVFWDQVFGTFYMPKEREEINFGLHKKEHLEYDTLWKLYYLPFKKIAARYLPAAQ